MSFYVYLLQCADDSYYTGYTTDLERRLREHNQSSGRAAKYTRSHRPVKLCYFEEFSKRSQAMKREYQLKQLSHLEKEQLAQTLT